MSKPSAIVLCALLGAALAGAWFWWQGSRGAGILPPPPVAAASVPVAAPAPSSPAILHPVPAASAASAQATSFEDALSALFGRGPVATLFRTDDFARRFVATVDNLGRSAAPAGVWPVNPAKGRFELASSGGHAIIGPDNGLRYTSYVLLLERVDLARAVQFYSALYPELQRAYEELGFPHGYFNDRFVAVLDQLLATPEVVAPLRVHRPVINGSEQPTRPWVLYEFDDPALQSLSAGQRTLLRMGSVNERRVKVRLAELRRLLASR